jgi:hypothetical protein
LLLLSLPLPLPLPPLLLLPVEATFARRGRAHTTIGVGHVAGLEAF